MVGAIENDAAYPAKRRLRREAQGHGSNNENEKVDSRLRWRITAVRRSIYELAVRKSMARFHIYLGKHLVGASNLEFGDPPMGVAFGRFEPNEAYEKISGAQSPGHLSVRYGNGVTLNASGGVHVEGQVGEEMEVSVLGIAQSEYEALFPEHVKAYERQFKNS
jgi:hypothetical protein